MKKRIVVFDVDHTLINGDCLFIAAKLSTNKVIFLLKIISFSPFVLFEKIGLIKKSYLKEKFLYFFKICDYINSNKYQIYKEKLLSQIKPEALKRINFHKSQNHLVVLCSASPNMLIKPLGEYLSLSIISTELFCNDGLWIPRIKGENCKGIQKLRKLELRFGKLERKYLEVYGDSVGDKELLEMADIPHYKSFKDYPRPYPSFDFNPIFIVFASVLSFYFIVINLIPDIDILSTFMQIFPKLFLGTFIVLISYFIRFIRWRIILKKLNLNPPFIPDFKIWMGSYAFTSTPAKAGEFLRCILLRNKLNISPYLTFPALLLERLTDLFAVLIFIAFNLTLIKNLEINFTLPFSLDYVFYLFFTIFLMIGIFNKFFIKLSKSFKKKLFNSLKINGDSKYKATYRKLAKPEILFLTTCLALAAWALEGLSFYIILQSLDSYISLGGAILTHTSSGLFGALSLMPGGIGTNEASTIGLLRMQDVTLETAIKATFIIRLMTLWFATFLGVLCLLLNKKNYE